MFNWWLCNAVKRSRSCRVKRGEEKPIKHREESVTQLKWHRLKWWLEKLGGLPWNFIQIFTSPFRMYFNNSGATMKPKTLVCQVPAKWMAFPTALAVLHVNYVSMLNLSGKHKKHLLFACQRFDCEHVLYFNFMLLYTSTPQHLGGKYCTFTPLHSFLILYHYVNICLIYVYLHFWYSSSIVKSIQRYTWVKVKLC